MRRETNDETVSEGRGADQAYGLGRILALSDGVFAFALTLLVVQLTVPTGSNQDSHHENFKYIHRYDGRLIALNFGSLLLIAFLPFPTAVLGRNQTEPLAAVAYAITLALSNLFSAATWWYATHGRRLVRKDLERPVVRLRFYRTLAGAGLFLLSIPLALFQPVAAEFVWSVGVVAIFAFLLGPGRPTHVH